VAKVTSAEQTLASVMAERQIVLPDAQVARIQQYCGLVWAWNAKLNLTRHTTYDRFVCRDLVDSLALARQLGDDETVLDVGTGGGVPGVILAIVRPDLKVSLCESVGKRARAVGDVVSRLGLNLPVHAVRAEDVLRAHQFNTLVARAVARLDKMLRWFRPRWDQFDRLLAVKGPAWVEERAQARHLGLLRDLALRRLDSYPMPDTDAESVILQICPRDRIVGQKGCRLRAR
jgi:16S rRNA (guanine527-N7)-methyltransferase